MTKYLIIAAPIMLGLIEPTFVGNGITFMMLFLAIASGLWVVHKHTDVFEDFDAKDIMHWRMDAMFYVLVTFSTALCALDLLIQTVWSLRHTLPEELTGMRTVSLIVVHSGFASFALLVHLIVGRLLSNKHFCELCRRPL